MGRSRLDCHLVSTLDIYDLFFSAFPLLPNVGHSPSNFYS